MARFRVTCPCCKGEKKTVTCEPGQIPGVDVPTYIIDEKPCTHCEGTGRIEAEVEESNE